MIDVNAKVREFLLADATFKAKVGNTRVHWPGLPEGVNPMKDGESVALMTRGGPSDPCVPYLMPSVQFKCYAPTSVRARTLYRAIYDALVGDMTDPITQQRALNAYNILSAIEQMQGIDLIDPETKWPFVLTFWEIAALNQ